MVEDASCVEEFRQEVGRVSTLLRDGKAFVMRLVTFTDFKRVLEERFGSGANVIFYEVGRGCGKRSCSRLLKKYPERDRLLKALCRHKRNEGWGKIKLKLNMETGKGQIIVYESFEAKQYGRSQEPVCHFLKGYLEGFLSQAYNKPIKIVETACKAQGNPYCQFEAT